MIANDYHTYAHLGTEWTLSLEKQFTRKECFTINSLNAKQIIIGKHIAVSEILLQK